MQVRAVTFCHAQCKSLDVALSVYKKKKKTKLKVSAGELSLTSVLESWQLNPCTILQKQDVDAESKSSFSSITLAASPKH